MTFFLHQGGVVMSSQIKHTHSHQDSTIIPSYRHFLAFISNPLLLRAPFSTHQALYPSFILCTASLSHPPSAATCDPRRLKQSTSSNGSPFSITCIRSPLPYLEHLITLLLPTFTQLSPFAYSTKLTIMMYDYYYSENFIS